MALYLGSNAVKINLNGVAYYLDIFSSELILNGVQLLSSNGYALKSSDGFYLTAKKEGE